MHSMGCCPQNGAGGGGDGGQTPALPPGLLRTGGGGDPAPRLLDLQQALCPGLGLPICGADTLPCWERCGEGCGPWGALHRFWGLMRPPQLGRAPGTAASTLQKASLCLHDTVSSTGHLRLDLPLNHMMNIIFGVILWSRKKFRR